MQGLQFDVSLLGDVCQIDCGVNVSLLSVSGNLCHSEMQVFARSPCTGVA